jgi:hypothetical protein
VRQARPTCRQSSGKVCVCAKHGQLADRAVATANVQTEQWQKHEQITRTCDNFGRTRMYVPNVVPNVVTSCLYYTENHTRAKWSNQITAGFSTAREPVHISTRCYRCACRGWEGAWAGGWVPSVAIEAELCTFRRQNSLGTARGKGCTSKHLLRCGHTYVRSMG